MSIHELDFDLKGNVIGSRCVDDAIRKAASGTDGEYTDMEEFDGRFPTLAEANPVPAKSSNVDMHKIPTIVRKLTAMSPDTVREEEFVLGFTDSDCGYNRMPISRKDYKGDEINNAHLRIGDKGFAYSSTDVYVAPKQKGTKIPLLSGR